MCIRDSNNTVGVYDPVKKIYRKNKAQENGIGDIIGILNGYHVEIETKRPNEKQLKSQVEHAWKVRAAGGHYFTAKSFDEAKDRIDNLRSILI